MNYTYIVRVADPKRRFLSVVYSADSADNLPNYFKNFNTDDFSVSNVNQLVSNFAPRVRQEWDAIAAAADSDQVEVSEGFTGSGVALLTVFDSVPEYNVLTQELILDESINDSDGIKTVSYTVSNLSQTEVSSKKSVAAEEARLDISNVVSAQQLLARKLIDPSTLTDEEVSLIAPTYLPWKPDGVYSVDDIRFYDNKLWQCLQGHTALPDWAPEFVPALWTGFRQPGAAPEPWVANGGLGPSGSYNLGVRVTHDNPNDAGNIWIYESAIVGNTSEPGRDSTFDRFWTPIQAV